MPTNIPSDESQGNALLRVQALSKQYVRGGRWRNRVPVAAVRELDLEICAGQTLALVGASGSGKSTVARCVTRLEQPDSGQIWFDGTEIAALGARDLLPIRSNLQMIFQDAAASMNPRLSAAEVIEEPLRIQGRSRSERRNMAEALMKEVALSPEWLKRSVMEFSGGQRQRLAIARALTLRPKLLVLDEALSGLDLPTQAQIANLLLDLQETHSLTYLLISHDLTLVARMADVLAVMAEGRILETGATEQIVADPKQAETKRLLASARVLESRFASAAGASA
jgi:ABC-type glutathione transport system ATPase component